MNDSASTTGVTLLVVAAPAEAAAVLRGLRAETGLAERPWELHQVRCADPAHPIRGPIDLIVTGIGKTNAAGAVGRVLDAARHHRVLSLGVAGALPGSGLALGAVVAATASVYADEGVSTPDGFLECAAIGFPLGPPPIAGSAIMCSPATIALLAAAADVQGPIATVSTCSGTDELAALVRSRTGALAEAMEGAAVGQVVARVNALAQASGAAAPPIEFGELRVISNTTGDRKGQTWAIKPALARLERAIAGETLFTAATT
ncbi:MAG: futalosine hydrolase [Phycisphaerales bacterium]|nr:futalosine hydrolase [Phycisphaerales bacterium]